MNFWPGFLCTVLVLSVFFTFFTTRSIRLVAEGRPFFLLFLNIVFVCVLIHLFFIIGFLRMGTEKVECILFSFNAIMIIYVFPNCFMRIGWDKSTACFLFMFVSLFTWSFGNGVEKPTVFPFQYVYCLGFWECIICTSGRLFSPLGLGRCFLLHALTLTPRPATITRWYSGHEKFIRRLLNAHEVHIHPLISQAWILNGGLRFWTKKLVSLETTTM